MSTSETKKAIDAWQSEAGRELRLNYLRTIAKEAGILNQFNMLPEIHIKTMDYREYSITLQGLSKIKYLKIIADCQLATG